jgi:serine/threonine-protein kinase
VPVGKTITTSGDLNANTTINYNIKGEQDQRLTAQIPDEGVLMTVLGPNGKPVGNRATRVKSWEGTLPFTGNTPFNCDPSKVWRIAITP